MKTISSVFFALLLFSSYGWGCKKDSYHEKIKFVNNSNENVVLAQFSAGKKDINDTVSKTVCFLGKLNIIRANGSVDEFVGKVNSIEDMLSSGRVFPYYIVSMDMFPQDTVECDSFESKIEYLKKFEPNLEELKASDFTYYYP